ncbi:MAG: ABC transporter permease [Fibrobacterota bacterium]
MIKRLEIGKMIEQAVDYLYDNMTWFFDAISAVVDTLVSSFQQLLTGPSPWLVLGVFLVLIHLIYSGSSKFFSVEALKKSWGLMVFAVFSAFLVMSFRLWESTMNTTALVISASVIALIIGIPLGILTARNDKLDNIVRPVLDFMQTMPPFVYLIPAIIFFGVGNVPGVIATVVFALPPAVRFTNLGIRNVPKELVEATESFGSTQMQLLLKVQLPIARSTILAGVNQVIMLSLSMVVIASMVGAKGLGQKVYQGITSLDLALGFEGGVGIVVLAIILDRTTQALGKIGNNEN